MSISIPTPVSNASSHSARPIGGRSKSDGDRRPKITAHYLLHHHSHILLAILTHVRQPSTSLLTLTCAIGHVLLNPPTPHLVHQLRIAWANRLLFHTPPPPDLVAECTLLNDMYPDVAHIVSPLALTMLATLPSCKTPTLVYQSASNKHGYASAPIPPSPHTPSSVLLEPFFIRHLFARTGPFRSRAHILKHTTWGPPTDSARALSRTWAFVPDAFLLVSYALRLGHARRVRDLLVYVLRIDPMLARIRAPLSVWVQACLDLRLASWLAAHALVTRAGNPQMQWPEWLAYVAASDVAVHMLDAVEEAVGARVQVAKWHKSIVGALVARLAMVRVAARMDRDVWDRLVRTVAWLRERGVRVVLSGEEVG